MATYTPNLNLSKAETSDEILSTLVANNGNFDTLDGAYASIAGRIQYAESTTNKVTEIDEDSTNTQYPGAKAVYDSQVVQDNAIEAIENILPLATSTGDINDAKAYKMMGVVAEGKFKQGELPSEYQQVEYIESTGSQYIDTGFIPNQDTEIDSHFYYTYSNDSSLFGARSNSSTQFFLNMSYNGSIIAFQYASNIHQTITCATGEYYASFKSQIFKINNNQYSITKTNFNAEVSLYLFCNNNNGTTQYFSKAKLYHCKIWDNQNLVRDFIPCYRKSDNVIGLYDLVNNTFYTNAGTGTFLKGADAPTPDCPQEITQAGAYNLFDGILELGIINGNTGLNVANSTTVRCKNYIPVEELTNYKLTSPDISGSILVYEYKEDFSYNLTTNKVIAQGSHLTTNSETKYIRFRPNTSTTDTNIRFVIAKGTQLLPYIPYGCIGLNRCAKNLAYDGWAKDFVNRVNATSKVYLATKDGRNCVYWIANVGSDFDRIYMFKTNWKENTQYLIKFDVNTGNSGDFVFNMGVAYTDGTFDRFVTTSANSWNSFTYTSSINKTIKYIRTNWNAAYTYIDLDTFMVKELSDGDDTYEPYTLQTTPINLNGNTINAVSSAVHDNLLIDKYGNAAIERDVLFTVFDGSNDESWTTIDDRNTGDTFYAATEKIDSLNNQTNNLICDYFTKITGLWEDFSNQGAQMYSLYKNLRIRIYKTSLSEVTIEGWRAWLSAHPIKVYYPAKTPTIIPLPKLSVLPTTLEGINHVWVDTNIGRTSIEVKYVEDLQKRIQELSTALVAIGGEA